MEKPYDSVTSLYRLDQLGNQNRNAGDAKDLGPLPGTSVTLMACLIVVWVLIGVGWLCMRLKKKT